jgi:hypothetical protein
MSRLLNTYCTVDCRKYVYYYEESYPLYVRLTLVLLTDPLVLELRLAPASYVPLSLG